MEQMDEKKAIEQYKKHLARLKTYYQTNKEKLNQSARDNFKKIKNDPEKYRQYKEKKREQYLKKKQKEKQENI